MFTGIIQETGKIVSAVIRNGNLVLTIHSSIISEKLEIGSSISINGACQTVIAISNGSFTVEAIPETLARSNLGSLKTGSIVNLEPPLSPESLLDGHIVQGHIDCVGEISSITRQDGSVVLVVSYPPDFERYVVSKGSIAVDGISLTVADTGKQSFSIVIIPHTFTNTILADKKVGDTVNLEFDIFAKYIEKIVSPKKRDLTMEFLREHGYS